MTPDGRNEDWGLTLYLLGCLLPSVGVFAWMFL